MSSNKLPTILVEEVDIEGNSAELNDDTGTDASFSPENHLRSLQETETSGIELNEAVHIDEKLRSVMVKEVEILVESIRLEDVTDCKSTSFPGEHLPWAKDSKNPLRWSAARRWTMVGVLASAAGMASTFSTAFEPALPAIMADLGSNSPSIASLLISIYVLGYIIGPLIIAPVSELYGRLPVIYTAYVVFLGSTAVCATSSNISTFIFFRAIMGFGGIAFLLMGPAIASDMIPQERHGLAMTVLSVGPMVGPTLGPIIGGYTSQALSWKWIFWLTLICMGLCAILTAVVLKETYAPVLQIRSFHKNPHTEHKPQQDAREKIKLAWIRPLKILTNPPIVLALALFSSMTNSYAMILSATIGTVFQSNYNMIPGASGLAYLGTAVGFLLGQLALADLSDRYVSRKELSAGERKPEQRLPPLLVGSILVPIGLAWYGWALHFRVHWIIPIIASGIIAAGIVAVFLAVQMYLVDAFTTFSASALGASIIVRSVFTAVVPLAANPLYEGLGYGWGNTVFALVAVGFVPVAVLLCGFSERIRTSTRFGAIL